MQTRGLRISLRLGVAGLMIAALFAAVTMQASAQDTEIIVPINELNGSGVSGDATLTDNGDGTTTIDVLVDGSTGGHPIHLHSGTCAELGDVVVALEDVDEDGASITTVDLPLSTIQDPEVGPHSINIHLSADEIATYVACGDIPTTEVAATGGETMTTTETTTTPATGVGSTIESTSSTLALMGMVAAALVFAVGMSLRRSPNRA
ncbi:MAG: hypothetical protein AB7G88_05145 [Thermomicrobiales bacterium]